MALRGAFVRSTLGLVAASVLGGGCSSTATRGGEGGAGGAEAVGSLRLPQFVRAAAWVDTTMQASIPLVVEPSAVALEAVEVELGTVKASAIAEGSRFVANLDVASLSEGTHALVARGLVAGVEVVRAKGTLVVGKGSRPLTSFSESGNGIVEAVVHDEDADALRLAWLGRVGSARQVRLRTLDGAFRSLTEDEVTLSDPADDALHGAVAFGRETIGVAYRVPKPNAPGWLVKFRVLGKDGSEHLATTELTEGEGALSPVATGANPHGVSVAWLHMRPPVGGKAQPAELRFARYDENTNALSKPLVLDQDQPAAMGSMEGPQVLEPLGELGVACNDAMCLVSYTRQRYDAFVALDIPKLFVARVDLATGQASAPVAVSTATWDTQLFGHQLRVLPDGGFVLLYAANDTEAAVTPKSACDSMSERDLLKLARYDASGALVGKPQVILDHEGTREYPRFAPHPSGFALLWEDQRSYCTSKNGHLRMMTALLDTTGALGQNLELPDSVVIPPDNSTVSVQGTNTALVWSDNRHGNGVLDPKLEVVADTLWAK